MSGAGADSGTGREAAEDPHEALRSLLGAWALDACPPAETACLEIHLASCSACADEAHRLRDAAGWLSADDPLEPAPALRTRVLTGCLGLRDPAVRVPPWASPFAAETAKLDALLRDLDTAEWQERAESRWQGGRMVLRPAELLCHLAALDALVGRALGLDDPVPDADDPMDRTNRLIAAWRQRSPEAVRSLWREQGRSLVEAAATAQGAEARMVDYDALRLPLPDAFLHRAFACWIHGEDIAHAVDYPYQPPTSPHLRRLIDLTARRLPVVLPAGTPPVHLITEGAGSGTWHIPPRSTPETTLVIDGLELCYLAAARREPDRVPCGVRGDPTLGRTVLHALPRLSRP